MRCRTCATPAEIPTFTRRSPGSSLRLAARVAHRAHLVEAQPGVELTRPVVGQRAQESHLVAILDGRPRRLQHHRAGEAVPARRLQGGDVLDLADPAALK